jgi:hypothetical protein
MELVVAIQCIVQEPISRKNLQAVLFVQLNDQREVSRLCAEVGWIRHVNGLSLMDGPPLWREILDLETGSGSRSATATDEGD